MNIINVGYDSTNYYVLANEHPVLLVDAGFPGTLAKFAHQCKRNNIEWTQIQYLLATHYHPDHAGLASELQGKGMKLIVLENQITSVPVLQTYFKPPYQDNKIDLAKVIAISNEESRAFLKKLAIQGEILHTPGHSEDSNTLILDDGAAFIGDLPLPLMVEGAQLNQVRESWNQLRVHQARVVYAGHGPSWQVSERTSMM